MNSRLDEMQAAVLRARLPLLAGWTERRRSARRPLSRGARDGIDTIAVPPEPTPATSTTCSRCAAARATRCRRTCESAGIETLIHYPMPIPHQPALAASSRPTARSPAASAPRCSRCRSIPALADGAVHEVAAALAAARADAVSAAVMNRARDAERGRRRCRTRRLPSFVLILAAQFGVFEAALRTWGSSEAAPAFQGLFEDDPRCRLPAQAARAHALHDERVRHRHRGQRAGVRDDDEIGPKAPDERRIVLLGDSLVLSVQVPFAQTFGELLEQRLNARPRRSATA